MGEAMADQDLMHTVELAKAALPYLDSKTRVMAELLTKILDVMGSFKTMTSNLAACGYDGKKLDVEGMLTGIRPVCNKKEREIVDRILNIFNMRRVMETYNNMMSAMKTMQEFGDFPFDTGNADVDSDTVTGNFSSMNFESIFQAMNSSNNEDNNGDYSNFNSAETNIDFDREPIGDAYDNSPIEDAYDSSSTRDDFVDENHSQVNPSSPQSNISNKRMLEMLKAMVPPEQQSTFENLSMLLNTMTYDNNSKPDDSKENENV